MEKIVEDKIFKQFQYYILGKEQQVLNVVLAPAQTIYTDQNFIICSSDGLTKLPVKKPLLWGEAEPTPFNSKFCNTNEGLAYMTLNSKGGRIIAFNALLLQGMLFHEDYILAHTHNVALKPHKYFFFLMLLKIYIEKKMLIKSLEG